jgi:hypothetical protein
LMRIFDCDRTARVMPNQVPARNAQLQTQTLKGIGEIWQTAKALRERRCAAEAGEIHRDTKNVEHIDSTIRCQRCPLVGIP